MYPIVLYEDLTVSSILPRLTDAHRHIFPMKIHWLHCYDSVHTPHLTMIEQLVKLNQGSVTVL